MNFIDNTSPGCNPDNIAAKSPGLSKDGPEMVRIFTSISLAMIFDSVVYLVLEDQITRHDRVALV